MKLIRFIVAAAILCAMCACTKFDDSALWQAINKNAADIAVLNETTKNLNSDILALQQLVAALQSHGYITNCSPLADGTGYTIAFSSGKSIVIRNGKNGADGKDGTTPQIGVRIYSDGLYYWTLNGEWLLGSDGNMIRAEGRDGKDGANGKDGITPQMKIEDGCWYISTDNGATWTKLGKATGAEDGDSFFKNVIVGTDFITFVLSDGTTFAFPFGGRHPSPGELIDMGLPSGLKWASCNLGATRPEEYGGYYQWAGTKDVTDKSIYIDWDNCPYHIGLNDYSGWTKYVASTNSSYWSGAGSPDDKTVLDPEDDVAHVTLGGKWRMPTTAEFKELRDNSTLDWTKLNGVEGMMFTSKKSGNSIFLPAAGFRNEDFDPYAGFQGFYWSSCSSYFPENAYFLHIGSDGVVTGGADARLFGHSVRPVSE